MEILLRHPKSWNEGFSLRKSVDQEYSSINGVLLNGNLIGLAKPEGKKVYE